MVQNFFFFFFTTILTNFISENNVIEYGSYSDSRSGCKYNLFHNLALMAVRAEKIPHKDWNERNASLAAVTKKWYWFFSSTQYLCSCFCCNLANRFPSSLKSVSCSCKLIAFLYLWQMGLKSTETFLWKETG